VALPQPALYLCFLLALKNRDHLVRLTGCSCGQDDLLQPPTLVALSVQNLFDVRRTLLEYAKAKGHFHRLVFRCQAFLDCSEAEAYGLSGIKLLTKRRTFAAIGASMASPESVTSS
jgi:hypothetical protein